MKAAIGLCALLFLLSTLIVIDQKAESDRDMIENAQHHWQSTFERTVLGLSHSLDLLAKDASLPFLVADQHIHSLSQLLRSKEKVGEVSRLEVLHASCVPLRPARQDQNPDPTCQNFARGKGESFFLSQQDEDSPAELAVVRRVSLQNQEFFLLSAAKLDQAWWQRLSPGQPMHLELKPQGTYPSEAFTLIKTLQHDRPFHLVFGKTTFWFGPEGYPYIKGIKSVLPALALFVLLLALFHLNTLRVARHRRLQEIQDLNIWCLNQLPEEHRQPLIKARRTTQDGDLKYKSVKSVVRELLNIQAKATLRFEKQLGQSAEKAHLQMRELENLTYELAKTPFYASLAKQVQEQCRYVREELGSARSLMEDFADVLELAFVPEIQNLSELSQSWVLGLREMSPRKFLRTLSERIHAEGQSQLDLELHFLNAACAQAVNITINMMVLSHKARTKMENAEKFTTHWEQMADPSLQVNPAMRLDQIVKEAFTLVRSSFTGMNVEFKIEQELDIEVKALNIPAFIWQSLVYHLIAALVAKGAANSGMGLQLRVHLLQKSERNYLLFQCSKLLLSHRDEEGFHLEAAAKICRYLPLKTEVLPALDDEVVALSWTRDLRLNELYESRVEG